MKVSTFPPAVLPNVRRLPSPKTGTRGNTQIKSSSMGFYPALLRFSGEKVPPDALQSMSPAERQAVQDYGKSYANFLHKAVCAPLTLDTILASAQQRGFKPFPQNPKSVKPGEKYYFNNGQSLALVTIGKNKPTKTGFNIVGAHMDSPQLALKPNALIESNGVAQLKTKIHGGGTWMSWFNRPLGIAGRIYEPVLDADNKPVLDPVTHLPQQKLKTVRLYSPSIIIPVEAIHVNPKMNKEGRPIDKEKDLNPVVGISTVQGDTLHETISENVIATLKQHGIDLTKASRSDLYLFPATKPRTDVGIDNSMILAQGHDDRSMCYASMRGILEASAQKEPPPKTSIAFFFNNEEVGRLNRSGATSQWVKTVAGKLVKAQQGVKTNLSDARDNALTHSIILSADVAHASIPPHAKFYDADNIAHMGRGPAITVDSNGAYATTPEGIGIVQDIAARANIPLQMMADNQNVMGGTTIGPMIAAGTNAKTVDIGAAIVSMHSTEELGAKVDFYLTKELFKHFFRND